MYCWPRPSNRSSASGAESIRVSSKWVASRRIEGGGKNGRDKYEVVKSGQKNFPPDGNGGFKHVINDPKTGTEVAARAEVQDFASRTTPSNLR